MPMNQRQIRFRFEHVPKQSADESLKMYIYDDVTSDGRLNWMTLEYEDSETSAKYIQKQLESLSNGMGVELHINSAGGEVAEGVTIYNLLKQASASGHKVTGYIDGIAYSVAMVIAMACDEIHMGLGTSMLLHYPWMLCSGNAEQLRGYADQLDALGESSLQLFLNRAGEKLTYDELDAMMRKETMLTPEQCLQYGFADAVDTYEAVTSSETDDDDEDEKDKTINQLRNLIARNEAGMKAVADMLAQLKPKQAITPDSKKDNPMHDMRETMAAAFRMAAERS